uniref:Uncharacterized protein n=1 Tax=Arundo donax TaxID=35708 RepID=A0A0A9C402_ARUDO
MVPPFYFIFSVCQRLRTSTLLYYLPETEFLNRY